MESDHKLTNTPRITRKLTYIKLLIYFIIQLIKEYRNEYIFKNTIANKIIKGRHRLSNVTYINEFRVVNSICDVAIFNGTSSAYEIKTELDNFDRLENQLADYKKGF